MTISRNYANRNSVITDDIGKFLEMNPATFPVEIYIARHDLPPESVSTIEDVVGNMEGKERQLQYDDPIDGRAMFTTLEGIEMAAAFDGSGVIENAGHENPVIMCITPDVTEQSVVKYKEYTKGGNRTVRLYVLSSVVVGQAPQITTKYMLIPLNDADFGI